MKLEELDNPEIILNLWFVHDDLGAIYSLRGRAYVGTGTDEEKLALLERLSRIDYLIAQPFPIPQQFHTHFHAPDREEKVMEVALGSAIEPLGGPEILFEDVYKELQRQLPAQTKLDIPQRPLICVTPLFADEHGNIYPKLSGRRKPRRTGTPS